MRVLSYNEEVWTMAISDDASLERKIFVPLHVSDAEFHSRWNNELYELYDNIYMAQRIKIQRLLRLGHVVRMDTNIPALKVFNAAPAVGSRGREKPPLRWKDQAVKDLASLGMSNWRRSARQRND